MASLTERLDNRPLDWWEVLPAETKYYIVVSFGEYGISFSRIETEAWDLYKELEHAGGRIIYFGRDILSAIAAAERLKTKKDLLLDMLSRRRTDAARP